MIETTIDPLVTTDAATIAPDLPASDGAAKLRDRSGPVLIVLDEREHVAGIVTESDFVALVAESAGPVPVEAIMSTPVVTVPLNTPVGFAADRMSEAGVKHLPVVDDGTYYGLVSLESLAPFLSRSRLRVVWTGDPIHIDANRSSERTDADSSSDQTANT